MHRLLIADTARGFADAVKRQLNDEYLIEVCHDGDRAVALCESFEPDILLMDMMLPGIDSLSVLHTLRTSGRTTKVIVTTRFMQDYVMSGLESLGVSYVFMKPCAVGAVVSCIRDIGFGICGRESDDWCLQSETDSTLLRLGFRMGPSRYRCVCNAILLKYKDPVGGITKCIYPEVAKQCAGNVRQVEKAIRDAIRDAWENGNKNIWRMYFPPGNDGEVQCPSNDVFIARIASGLRQRARFKKPYELIESAAL